MNFKFRNKILLIVFVSAIVGCSSSDKKDRPKAEYYGSSSNNSGLEVPPDLTQTDPNKNITVPGAIKNSESQSEVLSNRRVLSEPDNVKLLRDGEERWLLVEDSPPNVWTQLVEFWEKDGITLVTKNPESGVLETDWLINYADFTSNVGKIFRGLLNRVTSSGQRDKYRVRIDFGTDPNTTEVYVSHQGLEEVAIGPSRIQIPDYKWVKRPTDRGLEIAMMRQIMIYLGVDEEQADRIAEQNLPEKIERARLLIEEVDEPVLVLDDAFPRAWQRVGLALDRSGYIITGRNREQGGYLIELADPDVLEEEKAGFFARIFNRKKRDIEDVAYIAQVRLILQKDEKTVVAIASEDGIHDSSPTAISLLKQLHEQLK